MTRQGDTMETDERGPEKTGPEETKRPERPNEGQALSGGRMSEGPQFYYSRERRLMKAPASVRALYEDRGKPGFNLLRPLVSNRSNGILFGTVVVLALMILVMSISGRIGEKSYLGNRISVSALRYEGAVLVVLKKTSRGDGYTGPLDIAVSLPDGGSPVYPHRVTLSSRGTEEFRFSIPFDAPELLVEISGDPASAGEEAGLAFKIKSK
ncbi:MAG: hypothetical protein LBH51_04675 [Treponema sp.]|jgi:hypothetical protein|nr:hypothetical protein [Treponema sp.]